MPARLEAKTVPALLVRDMPATLEFYERLGFQVTGRFPEEAPTWAEVSRDAVCIQLHTEAPRGTPSEPVFSGTLYYYPSDVAELAAAWRDVVPFAWGPERMAYGMFEFGIRDPNGYYLAFTEPAG